VSFVIDAHEVRLIPQSGSSVARTAGVLRRYSIGTPLTIEELREAVDKAIAEEVIEADRSCACCSMTDREAFEP
jgi:hypothetical protein